MHIFRLSQLHITEDTAIFTIPSLLKHTKPGRVNFLVTLHQYPYDDDLLCPVRFLYKYIDYRESLYFGDTDELITFGNPYHPASQDTIARWIEDLILVGLARTFSSHILVVQFARHTLLVFQLTIIFNAESGIPIVHFRNFIVGLITQEVLNFLTAFCLQLIVHKTFCPLLFKAA